MLPFLNFVCLCIQLQYQLYLRAPSSWNFHTIPFHWRIYRGSRSPGGCGEFDGHLLLLLPVLVVVVVVWRRRRNSYPSSESTRVGRVVPVESEVHISIDITWHGVAENQIGKKESCGHDGWFVYTREGYRGDVENKSSPVWDRRRWALGIKRGMMDNEEYSQVIRLPIPQKGLGKFG